MMNTIEEESETSSEENGVSTSRVGREVITENDVTGETVGPERAGAGEVVGEIRTGSAREVDSIMAGQEETVKEWRDT